MRRSAPTPRRRILPGLAGTGRSLVIGLAWVLPASVPADAAGREAAASARLDAFTASFAQHHRNAWRRLFSPLGGPEPAGVEPTVARSDPFRTGLTVVLAATLDLWTDAPREPRWKGGILVDNSVRNGFKLGSHSARDDADDASGILRWVPYAVYLGDVAVSGVRGRFRRDGVHLLVNGVESFALAHALTQATKNSTGRQRPFARACARDPTVAGDCGSRDENDGFFSGHASTAFSGAGLVCGNHLRAGYSRNRLVGRLLCAVSLTAATATTVLRVSADEHYFSDVVVGGVVGFSTGYFLHRGPSATAQEARLTPLVGAAAIGISYRRAF